jgi:hypothetical protein
MRWRFGQLPAAGLSAPSFRMLPDALAIDALDAFEAAFVLDFALAAFFGAAFFAAAFFSAMVLSLRAAAGYAA